VVDNDCDKKYVLPLGGRNEENILYCRLLILGGISLSTSTANAMPVHGYYKSEYGYKCGCRKDFTARTKTRMPLTIDLTILARWLLEEATFFFDFS